MSKLDLSLFSLQEAVLQLKFLPAFKFWDCAGEIWADLIKKIPNLRVKNAEPNKTSFVLERDYEFFVEIDNVRIVALEPQPTLVDFMEKSSLMYQSTIKILNINEFTRIGCRLIYHKVYKNMSEASKDFYTTNKLNISNGKIFDIEGETLYPEIAFRKENDSLGASVRLRTELRKLDFEPPITIRDLKPFSEEKNMIVFDVDYFTKKIVTVDQLNIKEWVKQVLHLIRRDSAILLS